MIERVHVIGSGRVGSAVSARLRERGVAVGEDDPDVVLLCVPDTAIADVSRCLTPGRAWVGHVSGATPLAALDPHERRFSLHPLQTFDRSGDPDPVRRRLGGHQRRDRRAHWPSRASSRRRSACEPFELADGDRTLYHAGAVFASNYLVTLQRAAVRLGVPAEGLVPLMRGTIDHGFELTGPIARGDWATVEAHKQAIRGASARARAALRDARGSDGGDRMKVVRTIAELETAPGTGLVPTMGALHDGHVALLRAARAGEPQRRDVAVRQPGAVRRADAISTRIRATRQRDLEIAEEEGVDVVFAPTADELYPPGFATWVDPDETGAEGAARPGHFRGVATVCLKLFDLVRPERAYFGQKDAQQVAVIRRLVRDLNVPVEIRAVPTVRDPDGLALSSRNGASRPTSGSARSACLGRSRRPSASPIPRPLPAPRSTASSPSTSRCSTSATPRFSPPRSASAPPV